MALMIAALVAYLNNHSSQLSALTLDKPVDRLGDTTSLAVNVRAEGIKISHSGPSG
jgi:hypothetical protein